LAVHRRYLGPLAVLCVVGALVARPMWSALRGTVTFTPGRTVTEYVPLTTEEGGARASIVAEARVSSVPIYRQPGRDRPALTLGNPTEDHQPRVFLVVGRRGDWVQVLLPVRPNESVGWVRLSDVLLKTDLFRIEVQLSEHRITVWNGGDLVLREPVAVGRAVTETPKGVYFLTSLLQAPDPSGVYGPYAFGTSAFSDVLDEFAGGKGVIGIHGTNDPAAIGHDVSHGCIRIRNQDVTRLAGLLPLGTPVSVYP
jgi:hypothetical protein